MRKDWLQHLSQSLPTVPDILGREFWVNSAVLVLLTELNGEPCFVFELRARHIRQGGEICFPGGRFDPEKDSSFLETALRETEEELGISRDNLKILGNLNRVVSSLGAVIEVFAGFIESQHLQNLILDSREVERVFFEPVHFFQTHAPQIYTARVVIEPFEIRDGRKTLTFPAKELGLPEFYEKPWGHASHEILVYPENQCRVWGLTARLVKEFIRVFEKMPIELNKANFTSQ